VVVGGVTAVALVATASIAVLTGDGGPTVRTVPPAQSTTAAYGDGFSVDLPPGWVVSDDSQPGVLVVGTARLGPLRLSTGGCGGRPPGTTFVVITEFSGEFVDPSEAMPRPPDFTTAPANPERVLCGGTEHNLRYDFVERGRVFEADVVIDAVTPASSDKAAAYAVLNSFRLEPDVIEPPTVPTIPPVTVPASADTAAIEAVFARWLSTKPPEFAGGAEMVEDFDALVETLRAAAADVGNPQAYSGQVDAVTSIDGDRAEVVYSLLANGQPAYPGMRGSAVRIDGVWKVSRETICDYVAIGRIRCPAV
jgi:hypothetical protein